MDTSIKVEFSSVLRHYTFFDWAFTAYGFFMLYAGATGNMPSNESSPILYGICGAALVILTYLTTHNAIATKVSRILVLNDIHEDIARIDGNVDVINTIKTKLNQLV